MKTAADFFAGSGLVSAGLEKHFTTIWANDIDPIKGAVYNNNIKSTNIVLDDISRIDPVFVPKADLYWASFPCQDLSLAGKYIGLSGRRSSLVNEFLRIVQDKDYPSRPNIITLENVYGLITSNSGHDLKYIHSRLAELGYQVGTIVLNASHWVPQSRVRVFIIAIKKDYNIQQFVSDEPIWCHPESIRNIASSLNDFVFWRMPKPRRSVKKLYELIDRDEAIDLKRSDRYLSLIPNKHMAEIEKCIIKNHDQVFAGYKRTRQGKQTLEVRFDDIAGCLRTASGGSSKQIVVYALDNKLVARYLTSREAARLMGAPECYWLPQNKNDAYTSMGDAVVFPVTEYLSEFLFRLTKCCEKTRYAYA